MSSHSAAIPTLQEIEELLGLHDHLGAYRLARERLDRIPEDAIARGYLDRAERSLMTAYLAPFGDLACRVRVTMGMADIVRLDIDSRAAFLMSRIVDATSIEDLIHISGMSELETLHLLNELWEHRVIDLET